MLQTEAYRGLFAALPGFAVTPTLPACLNREMPLLNRARACRKSSVRSAMFIVRNAPDSAKLRRSGMDVDESHGACPVQTVVRCRSYGAWRCWGHCVTINMALLRSCGPLETLACNKPNCWLAALNFPIRFFFEFFAFFRGDSGFGSQPNSRFKVRSSKFKVQFPAP
jgi:hypothetical protein